eukprot:5265081-Pyramimonas_sp.AAC.1
MLDDLRKGFASDSQAGAAPAPPTGPRPHPAHPQGRLRGCYGGCRQARDPADGAAAAPPCPALGTSAGPGSASGSGLGGCGWHAGDVVATPVWARGGRRRNPRAPLSPPPLRGRLSQ